MSDGYCEVDFSDYSEDADPVKFFTAKTLTARKSHQCDECRGPIAVGETYRRNSYKFDGEMCSDAICAPCVEAATEFHHRVCGTLWDMFHEEWAQGAHLQACLNRLSTARAKEHMRAQWVKWQNQRVSRRGK